MPCFHLVACWDCSKRIHDATEEPAEAAFRLAARPGRVAALFSYINRLDLDDAVAVVETHEDALALEAADLAALAVEGRVAAQAAELDPHRGPVWPVDLSHSEESQVFKSVLPSPRLHPSQPALRPLSRSRRVKFPPPRRPRVGQNDLAQIDG